MLVVTSCDYRVKGLVDGHGVSFGFFRVEREVCAWQVVVVVCECEWLLCDCDCCCEDEDCGVSSAKG